MKVNYRLGTYDILFRPLDQAIDALPDDRAVITDENVYRIYGSHLSTERLLVLPTGEQTKSMDTLSRCLDQLADFSLTRRSTIVAFGGGVVGDLAGFAASAYMRGVPYVQIPTTLLAQVDSAVGGKVGVNLAAGKNLAGAFYPPVQVDICLEVLDSLDRRQLNNGMAEVWKYGFIADATFVGGLASGLADSRDGLEEIVRRCLEIKAEIVSRDEFERSGLRATLNFGHTLGHAIEQATAYSTILHGEAISIGMCLEAQLGERLGVSIVGTAQEIHDCLAGQGLPTELPKDLDVKAIMRAMMCDKKRTGTDLAFSLLSEVGNCKLVSNVRMNEVERLLEGA